MNTNPTKHVSDWGVLVVILGFIICVLTVIFLTLYMDGNPYTVQGTISSKSWYIDGVDETTVVIKSGDEKKSVHIPRKDAEGLDIGSTYRIIFNRTWFSHYNGITVEEITEVP